MEDAATSEISRSQVWQWLHHGKVSPEQVERLTDEEVAKLDDGYAEARQLFDQVATGRRVRRVPDAAGLRPVEPVGESPGYSLLSRGFQSSTSAVDSYAIPCG